VGKGVRTSPRDALIVDSTEPNQRGQAFGFHRAMDHLGAAIGPGLALLFLYFYPDQIRELIMLTVVPGACVMLLLFFGLRETTAQEPAKTPVHLTLAPFDRNFRTYMLALVLFTLGNSSDAFLLVRAAELGVPVTFLPLLWAGYHVVKSTANLIIGRGVDILGPRLFLFCGWLLYAAIYVGFGLATEAWQAWALFFAYALFYGLTEPAEKTLTAILAGPERKGLAFGWFNFATGIAALPASLIFGAMYHEWGALTAFGFGAGMAGLSVLVLVFDGSDSGTAAASGRRERPGGPNSSMR
jgi:MFS family permease